MIKKRPHKHILLKIAIDITIVVILWAAAYGSCYYLSAQRIAQVKNQANSSRIATQKAIVIKAAAREAKKKEPVYITLPGAQKIRAIVEDYLSPSSIWAVVSKTHPISVDYIPASLKIPAVDTNTSKSDLERSARSDITAPLKTMFDQANAAGYQLMIGSGYRSATLQASYFNSLANSVGEETANQSIARPGQSEHQTGLAADISTISQQCYLNECFADTSDGQWLVNNSYKYGFILRYPKGKETITGYQYEPWHFRYLATALHDSGLTLDEAWSYLETALNTLKKNGAI